MEVKKETTFTEQLEKIKNRGCIIGDETFALQALEHINYYRFTAYFLPFKNNDDTYFDGTTFNKVYRIYEFDRKLRTLLFSIVEEIELMLRTQLSYYHAHKYGALGYLDENNYNLRHNHDKLLQHINKTIENNRKQAFVKHHIDNHNSHFPIWVVIELFTMGELSIFYSDMPIQDQKQLANDIFKTTYSNVSSWLKCLTYLRNYCAHYSRLYYNLFPAIPSTPKGFTYTLGKRVFDYILVLKFLYFDPTKWLDIFLPELEALIEEYNDCIHLNHIGFPENWLQILKERNPQRNPQYIK